MKRLCAIFLILCCLTGCGKKAAAPDYTPAYTSSTLAPPEDTPVFQYLYGNGRTVLGVVIGNYEAETTFYLLEAQGENLSVTKQFSLDTLRWRVCLGLDDQDGIWVQGQDNAGAAHIQRFSLSGELLLDIDLGAEYPQWAVYGFSWDDEHYDFLVQGYHDAWLIQFDLEGQEVFRRSLNDYCSDTAGYLDREEDWMEELEGREGDRLLEMLYPDGPINHMNLFRFPDGSVGMMIRRQSPIDSEAYNILCTLEDGGKKAVPQISYELEEEHSVQLCGFFESEDPKYDLLITQFSGLYGLSLQNGTMELLISWSDAKCNVVDLSGNTKPTKADRGPNGELWFYEYDGIYDRCVVTRLTPATQTSAPVSGADVFYLQPAFSLA